MYKRRQIFFYLAAFAAKIGNQKRSTSLRPLLSYLFVVQLPQQKTMSKTGEF